MAGSEFENLPDEVLEDIFNYLLPDELLTMTLVSKRCNQVVGNSLKLMEKIALRLVLSKPNITKILTTKRRYSNLIIELKYFPHSKIPKILEKNIHIICGNIRDLKFDMAGTYNFRDPSNALAQKILQNAPKLRSLELSGVRDRNDNPDRWSVTLPNLQHLKLTDTVIDLDVIENFQAMTQFRSIKLSDVDYTKFNPYKFLLRQTELEQLELDNLFTNDVTDEFLSNFKIQLKRLIIIFDVRRFRNTIKIINTQSNLEELTVCPINLSDPYDLEDNLLWECVFSKKTVRKLTINYPSDCYDASLYHDKFLPKLEDFRISFLKSSQLCLVELKNILAMMPNIKTLHFSTNPWNDKGTFNENDIKFLNDFEQLECLYIGVSKSPDVVDSLELKNLKHFAVDSYYKLRSTESQANKIMTGAVWLPFLKRHPNLIELNTSNLLLSKYLWNYIDTQHPNLKVINIDVNNIRSEDETRNLTERHKRIVEESQNFRLKMPCYGLDNFKLPIVRKSSLIRPRIAMTQKLKVADRSSSPSRFSFFSEASRLRGVPARGNIEEILERRGQRRRHAGDNQRIRHERLVLRRAHEI